MTTREEPAVHPVTEASIYESLWYHTKALTGEYRAVSFSTRRSPLAGQYAGGTPALDGFGSCSITMYCWIRSKLLAGTKGSVYLQVLIADDQGVNHRT